MQKLSKRLILKENQVLVCKLRIFCMKYVTGSGTLRAKRDGRKRQTTPGWEIAGLISKELTYI